jgi:hypothetical protein
VGVGFVLEVLQDVELGRMMAVEKEEEAMGVGVTIRWAEGATDVLLSVGKAEELDWTMLELGRTVEFSDA